MDLLRAVLREESSVSLTGYGYFPRHKVYPGWNGEAIAPYPDKPPGRYKGIKCPLERSASGSVKTKFPTDLPHCQRPGGRTGHMVHDGFPDGSRFALFLFPGSSVYIFS